WVRQRGHFSQRHLQQKARIRVGLVRLRKPFHLCPLCELVSWYSQWHLPCLRTWMRWSHQKIGKGWSRRRPPPTLPRRGRPRPDRDLMRNYRWLILRRSGTRTRRQLLQDAREMVGTKPAVTMAVRAFIRRLPGSWDLVFRRPRNTRRANWVRQELVPL